jgi:hypothetical protein
MQRATPVLVLDTARCNTVDVYASWFVRRSLPWVAVFSRLRRASCGVGLVCLPPTLACRCSACGRGNRAFHAPYRMSTILLAACYLPSERCVSLHAVYRTIPRGDGEPPSAR